MSLRVFALLLCCSVTTLAQTESQDYLDESSLPLPTNGSKVRTPEPLAPFAPYRIRITSAYNLRPVYSESQENYETDIQIDGKSLRALSFEQGTDGHVSNLEFLYRGHGKPIYIGFGRDHYKEIENAQIEIHIEGWFEGVWRERFERTWRAYGDLIVAFLIMFPIIVATGIYFGKQRQKVRVEEKKAEQERQALMLSNHNKSLELMREIDRRAQQKAQEIMTRNYDEMQQKIMYWRTRAYTESYFLNPDLRQHFAVANREKVINELEKKWAQEFLEIAQDLPLAKALREQEPGVMHWIQARQEVVNVAHRLTWTENPVVDAVYEEVPNGPQIIIADELEETETAAKSVRKTF
jgi:hypothetical protein